MYKQSAGAGDILISTYINIYGVIGCETVRGQAKLKLGRLHDNSGGSREGMSVKP
jgi:hypothetical protein